MEVALKAKEYLKQALDIEKEINRLKDERQAIYDTLLSVPTRSVDKVQPSTRNVIEDTNMKLLEYSERIYKKVYELTNLKITISNLIEEVSNQNQRTILSKRYIELKSFKEIAVEMNYEYSWVTRIHGEALNAVEKSEGFKRINKQASKNK